MAFFQLLFGKNKRKGFTDPDGEEGEIALEMDAVIEESPEFTATPTRSPVEQGADVSDHVIINPDKLTIQGLVTNTPVSIKKLLAGVQFTDAANDARVFLEDLFRKAKPFDFIGGLKTYEDMIITSLGMPRNQKTGDALQFSCSMEKIRVVESVTVDVLNIDPGTSGAANQNRGTQTTKGATGKSAARGSSILSKITGFGA